ncbi:TM0996/MTH895 family glutaredoxin-like protein [candidate division KSB1 bacterium]|nr:TM0996/MTH895 family glutaredoxin-like protein [candidate division KSB1 bacterium]
MNIKILGAGCARCNKLAKLAQKAVAQLEINADVVKVSDLDKIMSYGVVMTPALVINEQVMIAGRIPSIEQLIAWIKESS